MSERERYQSRGEEVSRPEIKEKTGIKKQGQTCPLHQPEMIARRQNQGAPGRKISESTPF